MEASPSLLFESMLNQIWVTKVQSLLEKIGHLENRINELEVNHRKTFLTQKEVCSVFNIGHRTLKKWVAKGLNEIWLENRVYYDLNDIQSFLDTFKL